jgi:hypothetical protein
MFGSRRRGLIAFPNQIRKSALRLKDLQLMQLAMVFIFSR